MMNMTIIVRISEDQDYDKATGEWWTIYGFPCLTELDILKKIGTRDIKTIIRHAFTKYTEQLVAAQAGPGESNDNQS